LGFTAAGLIGLELVGFVSEITGQQIGVLRVGLVAYVDGLSIVRQLSWADEIDRMAKLECFIYQRQVVDGGGFAA
jgi:hypothetical protein